MSLDAGENLGSALGLAGGVGGWKASTTPPHSVNGSSTKRAEIVTARVEVKFDHTCMTCREEILVAAGQLKDRQLGGTFSVTEVLETMHASGTKYLDSTIRGYVISKMCRNAPAYHAKQYPDLERVAPGRYRLL